MMSKFLGQACCLEIINNVVFLLPLNATILFS